MPLLRRHFALIALRLRAWRAGYGPALLALALLGASAVGEPAWARNKHKDKESSSRHAPAKARASKQAAVKREKTRASRPAPTPALTPAPAAPSDQAERRLLNIYRLTSQGHAAEALE
ncbi:MAG: hypothetical protein ACTS8S_07230, partial [Giesbergeria sp.]